VFEVRTLLFKLNPRDLKRKILILLLIIWLITVVRLDILTGVGKLFHACMMKAGHNLLEVVDMVGI